MDSLSSSSSSVYSSSSSRKMNSHRRRSSTESVSSSQSAVSLSAKSRTEKRVRFQRTVTGEIKKSFAQTPANHDLILANSELFWWQSYEFLEIRRKALEVAEAVQRGGDNYTVVWDNKTMTSSMVPNNNQHNINGRPSYDKTLNRVYKSCLKGEKISRSTQRDLEFWVQMGSTRRGLERFIVPEIGEDREDRRRKVIDSVLYIQKRCDEEGIEEDDQRRSTILRAVSEKQSIPATRLAWIMASADASVASKVDFYSSGSAPTSNMVRTNSMTRSSSQYKKLSRTQSYSAGFHNQQSSRNAPSLLLDNNSLEMKRRRSVGAFRRLEQQQQYAAMVNSGELPYFHRRGLLNSAA